MSQFGIKSLKEGLSPEEKKQLSRMYWRTLAEGVNFCYSRFMGNGFAFSLMPFILWLYPNPEDRERKVAALSRHANYWNCEATMHAFAVALIASMEMQAAKNKDFDVASIEAVKMSLVGPLSAIGDTIFWVTWRVIVTGIALTFSLEGSLVGPILFLLLYNIPKWMTRYYLTFLGYKLGRDFLESAAKSGVIQHIIKAASVIGLVMIGGMVSRMIRVPLKVTFKMNGIEQPLINLFDGIVKGFLSLVVIFFMVWLTKKRVKPIYIVFGSMAVCIIFRFFGIF